MEAMRSQPGLGLSSMIESDRDSSGGFMKKTSILLADDHAILGEGLRRMLEPEFDVVGLVSNGEELVSSAKELSPDVIIADITMPVMNGIDRVRLWCCGLCYQAKHRNRASPHCKKYS